MRLLTVFRTVITCVRVYGVRREGNVDPAVDVHGELTSQNVLFKAETVKAASQALKVSGRGRGEGVAQARGGGGLGLLARYFLREIAPVRLIGDFE